MPHATILEEDDMQTALRARFTEAVDAFTDKLRPDPNVLAVIVSGSFAYDILWEKSDVDMTIVVRDQQLKTTGYALVENGITLNVWMVTRSEFRRELERQIGGSMLHSYLAKGKMILTRDESLSEFFEASRDIGAADMAQSAMTHANFLIHDMEKCRKWLYAGKDLLLTQHTLCTAAESLAHLALCLSGEPASRQSLRKMLIRDPELLRPLYQDPMSHRMTEKELMAGITHVDAYLAAHMEVLASPLLEYLGDGEIKTVTLIAKQFHIEPHGVTGILDWLVEKGVLDKVSQTIRITPKGRQNLEEIGYLYVKPI